MVAKSIAKKLLFIHNPGPTDYGHMNAVTALLNLFAATGHIHYAMSARLYVQEMRKLPSTHPWLHQKFVEEYHTVRRSERQWAELWTDIVIE